MRPCPLRARTILESKVIPGVHVLLLDVHPFIESQLIHAQSRCDPSSQSRDYHTVFKYQSITTMYSLFNLVVIGYLMEWNLLCQAKLCLILNLYCLYYLPQLLHRIQQPLCAVELTL